MDADTITIILAAVVGTLVNGAAYGLLITDMVRVHRRTREFRA